MEYDFKNSFNRFLPEAKETVKPKFEEVLQEYKDKKISAGEYIDKKSAIWAQLVGHVAIQSLQDYHNELMEFLKSKGIKLD